MDIRVLEYFLAVAREESITGAAEFLNMTQPPLSRQLKDLEGELGKQLFVRGNRKITLTEEGLLLRQRAQELIALRDKTKTEIMTADEGIHGDIYIGGGETEGMRLIARIARNLQSQYPDINYHIYSGMAEDVAERLDRGLLDFGVLIEPADMTKYDLIKLPATDIWGILMRKDCALAAKTSIKPEDLDSLPIICSNQAMVRNELSGWLGGNYEQLNMIGTYNLLYNASLMVEEGLGYALCLDGIIKTTGDSPLCFRPLSPTLEVGLDIVWKKYQVFSKPAEKFLKQVQAAFS